MGVFQAIAILPGVSRSGSTISGGLFSGVIREKAARFSFLMSIPAILGSLVFNIKDIIGLEQMEAGFSWGAAAVGMLAACIAGIVALKWMFSIIKKGKLWVFSIYVGILGILIVADTLFFHVVF
jgi:undecaprenyl-diphosphatase